MLLVMPAFAYKNSSRLAVSLYRGMIETRWCKHLLAYVLAGFIIAYHLSFYQTHRTDVGIYISSALMFATLASSKVVSVLKDIRRNMAIMNTLAVSAVLAAFIPQCLSLAVSLAFILELACFYPSRYLKFWSLIVPDYDEEQIVDAYFRS
ncbi:MAG: hypothetical protein ACOCPA_00295 [Segatella copri]